MTQYRQILVLSETSRFFGRDVLKGIQQFAQKQAQTEGAIPWRITLEDHGLLDKLPVDFDAWNGDAILSCSVSQSMHDAVQAKKKPFVEVFGDQISFFSEVTTDEHAIADMAIDYFHSRGFRHLGFYAYGTPWWVTVRRDLFASGALAKGLSCSVVPDCLAPMQPDLSFPQWKEGYRISLHNWIKYLPKPIGIWCPLDEQAIRVIEACNELGLRVPDQVAVLGTGNDTLLCSVTTPTISSLDINAVQIGYRAAQLLEEKIQNYKKTKRLPKISAKGASKKTPVQVKPNGIETRVSTDTLAIDNKECIKALRLIREQYQNDVSAKTIAEQVGVSRSTLDRLFRSLLGHSVEKEIYRLRIELAEKLLRETDLSVNEVALKTGFDRVEYFVRTFKKLYGDPPQRFRNRCKVASGE